MKKPGKGKMFRPHTVNFKEVHHAVLSDTLYQHGPNHVLELGCFNCEIDGVKVFNPPSTGDCEADSSCSHNTDAVDIHGQPFYIHDVNFTTGDDNIAGHANHSLVEDSYFGTGHGASIGSLCGEWLTNITFRNITFHGTTCGCRIKSHAGCGGRVWDVKYQDLTMYDLAQTIDLTQFYFATGHEKKGTFRFDQISFENIKSYRSGEGGRRRRRRRRKTSLDSEEDYDVNFDCDTGADRGYNCDVSMKNVEFSDSISATMGCAGVKGTADSVEGINSCLKSPAHGK